MSATMQRRDRLIPWYFVMFFVTIAIVDGIMVTLAVNTQSGVVTDHPYEKGLAYNKVVAAAEAQSQLGWSSEIEFAGSGGSEKTSGSLKFVLSDSDGKKLSLEKAVAYISRPTASGMDFSLDITSGQAEVEFPAFGLWEVRVEAIHAGTAYQQSRRIVVQ